MNDVTESRDRVWMALAIVLALFLSLTIGLTFNPALDRTAAGAEGAGAASGPHAVDVTLTEFAIGPEAITVPAGVPLSFAVTNAGVAEHDLTIEGVAGTETLSAGQAATLDVAALEPGTHRLICTVAGHEATGMTGELIVTEEVVAAPAANDGAHGGDAGGAHGAHSGMSAAELARMHDEAVASFPVESEGKGNQRMEPEIAEDGTKVFAITADEIEWETKPGVTHSGMAYNGQIPGPQIHVDLGDRIRIELTNELDEPTALHAHGLVLPNDMDGVPGITQPSLLPGETFVYEWTVTNAGSHMYHSHFNSAEQVTKGLLGAFIVHDPEDPEVDLDYVLIANDGPLGYTLNGKDFPATEPIVVKQGDLVRIRYMNEGLQIHPMHLHGIPQQVIAKDGYPLPTPHDEDTVLVGPGERIDVLVEATELGAWALHCHVLTHAEGPDGMFGMVTALVVTE
jgi:manganese oxidase